MMGNQISQLYDIAPIFPGSNLFQKSFLMLENMTSYFENPENIWVGKQFTLEEGAISNMCIYVPIEENGNSEAVTVD